MVKGKKPTTDHSLQVAPEPAYVLAVGFLVLAIRPFTKSSSDLDKTDALMFLVRTYLPFSMYIHYHMNKQKSI